MNHMLIITFYIFADIFSDAIQYFGQKIGVIQPFVLPEELDFVKSFICNSIGTQTEYSIYDTKSVEVSTQTDLSAALYNWGHDPDIYHSCKANNRTIIIDNSSQWNLNHIVDPLNSELSIYDSCKSFFVEGIYPQLREIDMNNNIEFPSSANDKLHFNKEIDYFNHHWLKFS